MARMEAAGAARLRYGWFVVGVLFLAALVAFVDRQIVAIVVDQMKADLGVGDAEIGWLYGLFAIFYAIAGLPIAWLADRYSRKHIIAAGVFVWSLMTIACGLSRNYSAIVLARIGVGVGEATLTPASTSLIADWFPPERVPLALSVLQAGPIVGSGLAFVIGGAVYGLVSSGTGGVLPWLGELAPWQLTFIYLGAPGLVLALLVLLLREPERRRSTDAGDAEPLSMAALWRFYRRHAFMLASHHFGFLCLGLLGYAFVFWTVSYFVRVHGLGNAEASVTFGWIFLVFGPMGPLLTALLAERLTRAGRRDGNLLAPVLAALGACVTIVAVQFAPSASWAFVLYAPAMLLVNAPFAMAYASLTVIAPPELRARIAACYMLVVSFGMMLGPPMAGFFNEHVFPGADGVRWSLITLTGGFGILGIGLILAACPAYRRLYAAEHPQQAAEL